jgi:hypothetical protein
MMSLGIKSGVNWMRLKAQVQGFGEASDEQRFRETGHSDEQAVTRVRTG